MNRFAIFTEVKKIYFTNNFIIYPILVFFGLIYLLENTFDIFLISAEILAYLIAGSLMLGIILQLFLSWHTYEPLKGTLDTYLELKENEIIVDTQIYTLDQIKTITILNYDYIADHNYRGKGNFNGILSNGIENLFKITLLTGEILNINFQQGQINKMSSARKELVSYYNHKKITFNELAEILGYKESEHEIVRLIIKDYAS